MQHENAITSVVMAHEVITYILGWPLPGGSRSGLVFAVSGVTAAVEVVVAGAPLVSPGLSWWASSEWC